MSNKYCSDACEISIPKEKFPEMQEALIQSLSDFNFGNRKIDLSNLKSVCNLFDWSVSFDSEGNINHILAYDELSWGMSTRERFVQEIASFASDGSFVEMHGEDGDVFRVIFQGGKIRESRPMVSWD